jgi:hypothetical protein
MLLIERRGGGGSGRHAPPDQGEQRSICQIAHGLEFPRSFLTATTTKPYRNMRITKKTIMFDFLAFP